MVAILLASTNLFAQKNINLTIAHKLGTSNFAFNQTAQNNLTKDFKITRVDYYISGIIIIHDGGMQMPVSNKYILAKGSSNVNENLGSFNVTNVEGIKFSIGVEAPTNNADPSLQPSGSPLAPQSPSMQWGWTAGYRFLALEGKTGNGFTTTFEMHGLGNANYFQQTVMAAGVNSGTNNVSINLLADYTQALKDINISLGPIDHGVDATDLKALQNFRDFVFSPAATTPLALKDIQDNKGITVFPNPTSGKLQIDILNKDENATSVQVINVLGQVITTVDLNQSNDIDLLNNSKGVYFLKFQKESETISIRKIILE